MLLPVKHFYWLLPPSSYVPHKRMPPRQVCCDGRVRYAGRRASHWAGACGEIEGHLCQFQLVLHPCTTPQWGWVAPPPCSLGWLARPWIRSDRRGVLLSEVENLPAADGILENGERGRLVRTNFTFMLKTKEHLRENVLKAFQRKQIFDLNHGKTGTNQSALGLARGVQSCSQYWVSKIESQYPTEFSSKLPQSSSHPEDLD